MPEIKIGALGGLGEIGKNLYLVEVDEKILKIWEKHPNRIVVPGKDHYFEKAEIIKDFVEKFLKQ